MDDALTTGIRAMQGGMERLNAIAQNLVNATTPGYRRSVPVTHQFEHALSAAAVDASPVAATVTSAVDSSVGTAIHTGKPLDLFIDGDGYFELAGPAGTGYSRQGSFKLSADGKLVNEQGHAVGGASGSIVANGPAVSVMPDGDVMQNGRSIGRIKLVRLDRASLVKGDDGLLRSVNGQGGSPDERSRLRVGHVEGSNVSVSREMVSMMQTLRSFEAMQRVLQTYDEQLGSAIQRLSEF